MVADKDNFGLLWPVGHHCSHEFLCKKRGSVDVNRVPLLPAANIDQSDRFTRVQAFGDLHGRNPHLLIRFVPCEYRRDYILHGQIIVPRADRGQGLIRTESTTRATANVVIPEESALRTRILRKKL